MRYGRFAAGALRGDLGESLYRKVPALELILERQPASPELAVAALVIALAVAVPIGVVSAVHRGAALDLGSMTSIDVLPNRKSHFFPLSFCRHARYVTRLGDMPPTLAAAVNDAKY